MEDFRKIVHVIKGAHPNQFDSQKDLAEDLGMSRQSMHQYLDKNKIPYEKLHRWMESKGYSLDSLYYDLEIQPADYSQRVAFENYIHFELDNDSMYPTFKQGDVLIAEPIPSLEGIEMKRIQNPGIFLIKNFNNSIECYRVIPMITLDRYLLKQDNPKSSIEEIMEEELLPRLVGKVVKAIANIS